MRYFSFKNVLIGGSAIIWLALIAWFARSGRPIGEILVNVIANIPFAIFVVMLIEYANRKESERSNRSRKRAVARAVQAFYQNYVFLITSIIADGVKMSKTSTIPPPEMVVARAKLLHFERGAPQGVSVDPIPYAAFFMCDFKGTSKADVYPTRETFDLLFQLAGKVDQLYLDIFHVDNGLLPDAVVDSLEKLKSSSTVGLFKNRVRIGS